MQRHYSFALGLGALVTVLLGGAIGVLFNPGTVRYTLSAEKNPGGTEFLSPELPVIDVGIQLLSLDTDAQFADIHYVPQPAGDFGDTDWFENRVELRQHTRITVGSVGLQSGSKAVYEYQPGPAVGFTESLNAYDESIPEEAYIRDYDGLPNMEGIGSQGILGVAASEYPFDAYLIDVGTRVAVQDEQGNWIPVGSSAYFAGTGLPGMEISVNRVPFASDSEGSCDGVVGTCDFASDWSSGESRLQIVVSRSSLTIAIGLFGFLLTSICAINSVAITLMVIRRNRPPSLNVMALHAAVLFSLPAIRASIPGAPKLGIALDAIAFFPAIVLVISSLALCSYAWATRADSISS
jgi:hypothetical protein